MTTGSMTARRRAHILLATGLAGVVLATLTPTARATEDALDRARGVRIDLQERVATAVAELENVRARVELARDTRATLESDVRHLQALRAEAEEAMVARALNAFRQSHHRHGTLGLLMGADDAGEVLAKARMLQGAERQQRDAIERAVAARTALAQRRARLDELVAQLEVDEARLAHLQRELEVAFRDAQARESELASRRARQRRISRGRLDGTYACPIKPPFSFRDTWGAPRSGGRRHKGVDIFGPMGQEVYAITHGSVLRHSNSRLGGIGLYLRGDDGNTYYYTHLQRIAPGYGPGRRVEAGELIAFNGNTGNARGGSPHIHFEVHPGGGAPINPYPFAAAACF